jgi:phage-related protein
VPVSNYYDMQYDTLDIAGDSPYALVQAEGFASTPDIREFDTENAQQHGETFGDDFLNKRVITLQLEAHAETDEEFDTRIRALQVALAPGQGSRTLKFRLPGVAGGGVRQVEARTRKISAPIERERWFHRLPVITVQLECSDPRMYDATETEVSTTLPIGGGGLTFPLTFPIVFEPVDGGSLQVPNEGTFPTLPVLTIFGPCTVPKVTHVQTDSFLQFNLSLAEGSFLEIDFRSRTVLLNGSGNRYNTLVNGSSWFEFTPGSNELRFNASSGMDAILQARYRSAWV